LAMAKFNVFLTLAARPAIAAASGSGIGLRGAVGAAALAFSLVAGLGTQAAAPADRSPFDRPAALALNRLAAAAPDLAARFDPAARATHVTARVPGACAGIDLPLAWTLVPAETSLVASLRPAQGRPDRAPILDLALRESRNLPPVPTLASRDGPLATADDLPRRAAAALQREHEETLGRPAQTATLTPLTRTAWRWTASWLDPHLPAPLTRDTVLLALSPAWVLELTLSGAGSPEIYEELIGEVMGRVRVEREC
jgi:hypothetical protein